MFFLVCGRKPDLGRKVSTVPLHRHVGSTLSKNIQGRLSLWQDDCGMFLTVVSQLFADQTDAFVNVIKMYLDNPEFVTLDDDELIVMNVLKNILPAGFEVAVHQSQDSLVIDLLWVCLYEIGYSKQTSKTPQLLSHSAFDRYHRLRM